MVAARIRMVLHLEEDVIHLWVLLQSSVVRTSSSVFLPARPLSSLLPSDEVKMVRESDL